MAHPCIECNGECYCGDDMDDAVVCKTPSNCETFGCNESGDFPEDNYDYEDFECCAECDLPDACSDFGCAVKQGLKEPEL